MLLSILHMEIRKPADAGAFSSANSDEFRKICREFEETREPPKNLPKIRGPPGPPGNLRGTSGQPSGNLRGTTGDLWGPPGNLRGPVGATSGEFLGCQRHFSSKITNSTKLAAECGFLHFLRSAFVRINAIAVSGLFVQVPGTGTQKLS